MTASRRFFALFLAVAGFWSLPGAALAQTNLSLGKTATASSVNGAYVASRAIDGSLSSRWQADTAQDAWIRVDLGSDHLVNRVILHWENAYGRDYIIQTSLDGTSWTDRVAMTNGNGGEDLLDFPEGQVTARYVRMQGVLRGTQWGYSLREFEIYNTGPAPPAITSAGTISGAVGSLLIHQATASNSPHAFDATGLPPGVHISRATGRILGTPSASGVFQATITAANDHGEGSASAVFTIDPEPVLIDFAEGRPATTSSHQGAHVAANANDSSPQTRWSAANGTFPQWWRVDLGEPRPLSRMDVDWYGSASRAYGYEVEISTDGATYTPIVEMAGNRRFGKTADPVSATARYVRVTVTRATAGFASAYGIRVLGVDPTSAIRIVSTDTKVQSRKRGVSMNTMSAADFLALSPGVSWYYNWATSPGSNVPPAGAAMTFCPMQWGNSSTAPLANYLASANPKPPVVLAVNEPNLRGQAFINPQTTANLFRSVQNIANLYGIPVVGPHMAAGSAPSESITATDPFRGPNYLYTSMLDFLDATLYFADQAGTNVPAIGFHGYDNAGAMRYFVDLLYERYQRPIWVTEFAWWNAANATEARDFLIQTTDFLERSPKVAGYAFFKERASDGSVNISLLAPQSGVLSALGTHYVALPPHDSDLYYRIPGRLQAENYVAMADANNIRVTTDSGGAYDITLSSNGPKTVDYNIQVDVARTYTILIRAAGTGTITLSKGGTTLGSVAKSGGAGWQTLSLSVPLPAGPQTLRVSCSNTNISALNWIEFQ